MTQSVTLDDLDRRLVHALQVDGRAPFSRIAAVLGVPERTLARRYHRLRSALAVRVAGLVDSARIGMADWFVTLDCAPDATETLTSLLAQRDDTSWIAPLAGGGRLVCMVRTPAPGRPAGGPDGGRSFFEQLARTPGVRDVQAGCVLRAVAGVGGWSGRTSALDAAEQERLRTAAEPARSAVGGDGGAGSPSTGDADGAASSPGPGPDPGPTAWTEADARLAGELARDGRADIRHLAEVTGWSASTTRRRISRLRSTGVLHFEVDVDPAHFGAPLEALLWLDVAPGTLPTVTEALAGHAPVAFAAATTGRAAVFAMLQCRDAGALYEYLSRDLGALPGIRGAETALVQRRTKRAGTLLLPERHSSPPKRAS
ncbi:Lrp/AsnC family transcriptional regulator [Streptomyces triticagri]|uniref:Lrp/AsnC family transcriptional regulator n=1 Tax=Streptomyces triticagri TaxID=2293568 RepID=A0A372LYW2_9ACTN|nr:Lrp/AsnC family transcriptional regulator [Streptomyces triticagri]RFU83868.1 Lrp/AsnC family transcriptional regulator [Streptomyces triticagri]